MNTKQKRDDPVKMMSGIFIARRTVAGKSAGKRISGKDREGLTKKSIAYTSLVITLPSHKK